MSFPTPPDDRGYSRYCTACGGEIHHCNFYGMGTCPTCGFKDRPTQDDNDQRARAWAKEHPVSKNLDVTPPSDGIASTLIDAITDGYWDAYLKDIANAIGQRQSQRRDQLLAQIQEVYGPNATIQTIR